MVQSAWLLLSSVGNAPIGLHTPPCHHAPLLSSRGLHQCRILGQRACVSCASHGLRRASTSSPHHSAPSQKLACARQQRKHARTLCLRQVGLRVSSSCCRRTCSRDSRPSQLQQPQLVSQFSSATGGSARPASAAQYAAVKHSELYSVLRLVARSGALRPRLYKLQACQRAPKCSRPRTKAAQLATELARMQQRLYHANVAICDKLVVVKHSWHCRGVYVARCGRSRAPATPPG